MPNKDLIKARKQAVGKARAKRAGAESAAGIALGQPTGRSKSAGDAAARKRFFVKTRSQELKAAGKKVDRAKLAKRYESGKVKRAAEFYAGGKKEAAKRVEAAKPKPKPNMGRTGIGSARGFEGTGTTGGSDTKNYKAAAYMALGQSAGKSTSKSTTSSKSSGSVRAAESKKPTTTKKPATTKKSSKPTRAGGY